MNAGEFFAPPNPTVRAAAMHDRYKAAAVVLVVPRRR
jgi:hypothetical protein